MKNGDKPIASVLLRQVGKDEFRIASEKDSREGQFLISELGLTKFELFALELTKATVIGINSCTEKNTHHGWSDEEFAKEGVRLAKALLNELENSNQ